MFDVNDIVGKDFGYWYVLEYGYKRKKGRRHYYHYYKCICKCGKIKFVNREHLLDGKSKSCGCFAIEQRKINAIVHDLYYNNKKLYGIYSGIKERCLNSNNKAYSNYGGRGIKICDEWKNDFKVFYDWAMSNGYQENLTIDRIDVNGNYEPNNCRWITRKEQSRNKRNTIYITYKNETKPLIIWCELLNLPYAKVKYRLKHLNWNAEKAFSAWL